jgi:5-(carboxyamino)imidazole ribonucleotide synthase
MLAQAAWPLGATVQVLVRRPGDALPGLTGSTTVGNWNDPAVATAFARTVDLVLLENEFINPASLDAIEAAGVPLVPGAAVVRGVQDKWRQKQTLQAAGLPVVPAADVASPADVRAFAGIHGWPVVLKRRHEGYDGKGNATLRDPGELDAAWNRLAVNEAGLYAEAFCPFDRELAVMVCRSITGETAVYPVVDTVQRDHICHTVAAPSSLPPALADQARATALAAVEAFDGRGMFGVELFLTRENLVLINELAPRVHNSGHYTIEGCACSQFENHLRAAMGWPLGSPAMTAPHAVMVNLLGASDGPARPHGLAEALAVTGAHLHLYGKDRSVTGRKMGHVTALGPSREAAETTARLAAGALRFGD